MKELRTYHRNRRSERPVPDAVTELDELASRREGQGRDPDPRAPCPGSSPDLVQAVASALRDAFYFQNSAAPRWG